MKGKLKRLRIWEREPYASIYTTISTSPMLVEVNFIEVNFNEVNFNKLPILPMSIDEIVFALQHG